MSLFKLRKSAERLSGYGPDAGCRERAGIAGGLFPRKRSLVSLKQLTAMVLVAGLLPALSACGGSGFRPLHGPTESGENLGEVLAGVEIEKIPGRVGQKIRNELIFQTTGGNYANAPTYTLAIVMRESVTSTLVQRSGESLGQVYNLDVNFELNEIASDKTILKGKSFGRAGFERFVSAYSNVRARIDAEDRAAKSVAREIKGRVAAFLASRR